MQNIISKKITTSPTSLNALIKLSGNSNWPTARNAILGLGSFKEIKTIGVLVKKLISIMIKTLVKGIGFVNLTYQEYNVLKTFSALGDVAVIPLRSIATYTPYYTNIPNTSYYQTGVSALKALGAISGSKSLLVLKNIIQNIKMPIAYRLSAIDVVVTRTDIKAINVFIQALNDSDLRTYVAKILAGAWADTPTKDIYLATWISHPERKNNPIIVATLKASLVAEKKQTNPNKEYMTLLTSILATIELAAYIVTEQNLAIPDLTPVIAYTPPQHSPIIIAKDGNPIAKVYVAKPFVPPDNKKVSDAGAIMLAELLTAIKLTTGAQLEVVTQLPSTSTPAIIIGDCTESQAAGIDATKIPIEGFVIKTAKNRIYLVGSTITLPVVKCCPTLESPYANWGTVWAIADFLERFVGVRWYWPIEGNGRSVINTNLLIAGPAYYSDSPTFRKRVFYPAGSYTMPLNSPGLPVALTKMDVTVLLACLRMGNSNPYILQVAQPMQIWKLQQLMRDYPTMFELTATGTRNWSNLCYGNTTSATKDFLLAGCEAFWDHDTYVMSPDQTITISGMTKGSTGIWDSTTRILTVTSAGWTPGALIGASFYIASTEQICVSNTTTTATMLLSGAALTTGTQTWWISSKMHVPLWYGRWATWLTTTSITISPFDAYLKCYCHNCQATRLPDAGMSATASLTLETFVKDFCITVKARWPNKKVIYLPYYNYNRCTTYLESLPTGLPAGLTAVTDYPDNLKLQVTTGGLARLAAYPNETTTINKNLSEWYKKVKAGEKIQTWEYTGGTASWTIFPYQIAKAIQAYYIHNKDIINGSFINGTGKIPEWTSGAIFQYCLMKILWNPNINVDAIIDTLCSRMFGTSASMVRSFIDKTQTNNGDHATLASLWQQIKNDLQYSDSLSYQRFLFMAGDFK